MSNDGVGFVNRDGGFVSDNDGGFANKDGGFVRCNDGGFVRKDGGFGGRGGFGNKFDGGLGR